MSAITTFRSHRYELRTRRRLNARFQTGQHVFILDSESRACKIGILLSKGFDWEKPAEKSVGFFS